MARLSLRRFTFSIDEEGPRPAHRNCPAGTSGCDASVMLDDQIQELMEEQPDGYRVLREVPEEKRPGHDDPRWPTVCAQCGEPFVEGDEWQVNQNGLFVRSDNDALVAFRGYGDISFAGALYDMWWRKGYTILRDDGTRRGFVGPDGISLCAICPNGLPWEVDGPATGGGGWTRTGDPRRPETLTVQPSIIAGKPGAPGTYHGFLQNGAFTAHIG